MIKEHVPGFGIVFLEGEMKKNEPTTDEYIYTDWLDLKSFNISRFLVFVKETGGINAVKYKVQTTTELAEDGDEVDLKDKDDYSEWAVPAGNKDYQVVEEPWPKLRVGFKSAIEGNSGSVTIRVVAR